MAFDDQSTRDGAGADTQRVIDSMKRLGALSRGQGEQAKEIPLFDLAAQAFASVKRAIGYLDRTTLKLEMDARRGVKQFWENSGLRPREASEEDLLGLNNSVKVNGIVFGKLEKLERQAEKFVDGYGAKLAKIEENQIGTKLDDETAKRLTELANAINEYTEGARTRLESGDLSLPKTYMDALSILEEQYKGILSPEKTYTNGTARKFVNEIYKTIDVAFKSLKENIDTVSFSADNHTKRSTPPAEIVVAEPLSDGDPRGRRGRRRALTATPDIVIEVDPEKVTEPPKSGEKARFADMAPEEEYLRRLAEREAAAKTRLYAITGRFAESIRGKFSEGTGQDTEEPVLRATRASGSAPNFSNLDNNGDDGIQKLKSFFTCIDCVEGEEHKCRVPDEDLKAIADKYSVSVEVLDDKKHHGRLTLSSKDRPGHDMVVDADEKSISVTRKTKTKDQFDMDDAMDFAKTFLDTARHLKTIQPIHFGGTKEQQAMLAAALIALNNASKPKLDLTFANKKLATGVLTQGFMPKAEEMAKKATAKPATAEAKEAPAAQGTPVAAATPKAETPAGAKPYVTPDPSTTAQWRMDVPASAVKSNYMAPKPVSPKPQSGLEPLSEADQKLADAFMDGRKSTMTASSKLAESDPLAKKLSKEGNLSFSPKTEDTPSTGEKRTGWFNPSFVQKKEIEALRARIGELEVRADAAKAGRVAAQDAMAKQWEALSKPAPALNSQEAIFKDVESRVAKDMHDVIPFLAKEFLKDGLKVNADGLVNAIASLSDKDLAKIRKIMAKESQTTFDRLAALRRNGP